ncbi:MAG: CvpA family protein [Alphaproteobacteria bacterium]
MEFLDSMPFTFADVIVVLLIAVSGLLAFFRGLITEALAVAGWLGAAIVTVATYTPAQALATQYFAEMVKLQILIDVATGIILFVVSLIVFSVILRAVARLVRGKEANPVDRVLGFVFGLVRGVVLLAVVWLLITAIVPIERLPRDIREAKTLPMIRASGDLLMQLVPPSLSKSDETPLEETRRRAPTGNDTHDFVVTTPYKGQTVRFIRPQGQHGQAT